MSAPQAHLEKVSAKPELLPFYGSIGPQKVSHDGDPTAAGWSTSVRRSPRN